MTVIRIAVLALLGGHVASGQNLVVNGSFELPDISPLGLNFFPSLPGWALVSGSVIEVCHGCFYSVTSAHGFQHLELDGEDSTAIAQDVPTIPGRRYRVSFWFSPRRNIVDNRLIATWDGATFADITATGVGLTDASWVKHSYLLTSSSEQSTRITFADASVSDSLGTLLDDVTIEQYCAGDTDGDGFVGFADLNNILAVYNAVSGDVLYIPALDLDADGLIGFSDLNLVLSEFNQDCD